MLAGPQVLLKTSLGDLDIELWPKEAPMVRTHVCRAAASSRMTQLQLSSCRPATCTAIQRADELSLFVLGHQALSLASYTACQACAKMRPLPSRTPTLTLPQAVRNFVQLCMEGYYDGCVFHWLLKDFLIQTGDPTGTGSGGESAYGRPFKDEFHSRLNFAHRWVNSLTRPSPENPRRRNKMLTSMNHGCCPGRYDL